MENIKTQSLLLIETLKKINYVSLEQLVEDINRNFAVVENSPLFKGIPGNEGEPGDAGLRGSRGSQFIFVYLDKFVEQFPKELQAGSNITLDYINSKLIKFEDKQKLLKAFGVSELVNNDIIVLTNSSMLSYDISRDYMINTGLAFNEQSNIISSIEKKIEGYVKYFVDNNPTILSLQNIFEHFTTIGKNYADTNNTFVTRRMSANSALMPFVSGISNMVGTVVTDHKYFGFSEKEFPLTNKGTIVFGSMGRYTQLMMETFKSTTEQTVSGGYVPTDNAIPSVVFLQDTYNAGLMFGYKGKSILKRFASIYKNSKDEVVFKSDMGNNKSEFSELLLHKDYLKYEKLVDLLGDIHLVGDYEQSGNMSTPFIRTAKYSKSKLADTFELGIMDVDGKPKKDSICRNMSDVETYENYPANVFVTDDDGVLLKTYSIEKEAIPALGEVDLNTIAVIPNNDHKVVTSNYLGVVLRKINSMCKYIIENYWRKNQWNTGDIPALWLKETLLVGSTKVTPQMSFDDVANRNIIGKNTATVTTINGDILTEDYKTNVLVTDSDGLVLHDYSLETSPIIVTSGFEQIITIPDDAKKVVTSNYLGFILRKINNMGTWITDNYWRKNQWNTGVIPDLHLSNNLRVDYSITNPLFNVDQLNDQVKIGKVNSGKFVVESLNATFNQYKSNVFVTDAVGNIVKSYSIETAYNSNSEIPGFVQVTPIADSRFKIPTSSHINWLSRKINAMITYVNVNYWRKNQHETFEIPNLFVNESLKAKHNIVIGVDTGGNNVVFNADAVNSIVVVGKKNITSTTNLNSTKIKYDKFKGNVIVCDPSGFVLTKYGIEFVNVNTENIWNIPESTTDALENIDLTKTETYPNSDSKVVTSNYFAMVVRALNNIKIRFKDTFNQYETRMAMYDHMPVGSIISWSNISVLLLQTQFPKLVDVDGTPKGWVICDGRLIPGTTIATENMTDCYLRGCVASSPNSGGNNTIKINENQLPKHTHNITYGSFPQTMTGELSMNRDGAHQHRISNMLKHGPWAKGGTVGAKYWADTYYTDKGDGEPDINGSHTHKIITSKLKLNVPLNGIDTQNNVSNESSINIQPKYVKTWFIMKYKNI